MRTKRGKGFKLKLFLYFFLFLSLLVGLFFFLESDFWSVKKIDCRLEDQPCPTKIWSELMSLGIGKNLLFLSSAELETTIKQKNSLIKTVEIKKRIPSRLVFKLKQREIKAAVVTQLPLESEEATKSVKPEFLTTEDFFLVDEEGVVLAKEKATNLPLILIQEKVNLNVAEKFSRQEIIQAIDCLTKLRLVLFQPQLIRVISSWHLEAWLKNGFQVEFSTQKDFDPQIASLQLIFSQSKIDNKRLRRVDLRFDKPVVVYE